MADNYFVTAVLVSHDGAEWLPEVIAALFAQSRQIDRIVAVDNGSVDGSAKLITNAGISLIKSDRESGFGDAIDLALDATKPVTQDKEELIWLLHDDCAPARHALAKLISGFENEPLVAMVGPKLRGWRDRNKLLEVGISIAANGARWTGLESQELDQGQHDVPKEVLAVSTAAALIRRNIYEDLGGLDPNLAIFRDDIDLGWRLWLAGFEVKTAPEAVAYHVEAAANERRSVDVEEAFLHRPHLLDRRNATFVLLANVSWWLIPWVALQLIGTAAIRSIGYLLAKLPGYALDEIAAVGLVIIQPNDLRKARKIRRPKRLLSPRLVREFIPPRGSQIRQAWERTIRALSKNYKSSRNKVSQIASYADIGELDESFDDQIPTSSGFKSRIETLRNRPFLFGIGFVFLVNLFAARNRYGSLSGGAMPIAHGATHELLNRFIESWHPVAMGSAASAPSWLGLATAASSLTLGNVSFFFSALYFLAPLIAFIAMYRATKRHKLSVTAASVGGLIYSFSPVIWNSINEGRLGTLIVALLVPSFLSLNPLVVSETSSWRRTYALALFAGIIGAFSSILLFVWLIISLTLLGARIFNRSEEIKEISLKNFLLNANLAIEKRLLALGLLPIIINFPWSASLILHPTQILLEPGLPFSGGKSWELALFNPGGESGLPIWIFSPLILFLLVALFSKNFSKDGAIATFILSFAVLISPLHIYGHGSIAKYWAGSLLVVVESIIIPIVMKTAVELLPNLRNSRFGLGHLVTALISFVSITSIIVTAGWAASVGANSVLKSASPNVIPAFIASLSDTSAKPKTLVLSKSENDITFFITRGLDLELGEPDVTVAMPAEIESAVDLMISGTGINSSKVLGANGIKYVFLRTPIDSRIVRTIDGLGGFVRSSATNSGIVWRIIGSLPRLSIKDSAGNITQLDSGVISAETNVNTPGVITLAEKYDGNWRLLLNGKNIKLEKSDIGEPIFNVIETGKILLQHDGTRRRAALSIGAIAFLTVLVLALPAGRRRKEMTEL